MSLLFSFRYRHSKDEEAVNNASNITERYIKLSWEFIKIKTLLCEVIIPAPEINQGKDKKESMLFPLHHPFISLLKWS